MQRSDFEFELPDNLIAHFPALTRSQSRLLSLDGQSGELTDMKFVDLPDLLNPGDLLVFNNTKVIRARLFGQKTSGGKLEVLIERVTGTHTALAQVRASKSPKPGQTIILADGAITAEVVERQAAFFLLRFLADESVLTLLDRHGHIPLPPYITRADTELDESRYQTVYGTAPGAVAAPTAGLHFDQALFDALQARQVNTAFVTLHVGSGTFQPVRVDNIADHQMHSEYFEIDAKAVAAINQARAQGRRVIAVGTTSVRVLESVGSAEGNLRPCVGETDIFIYPGYQFKVVDALITNFHLPGSTLIMLVSAFAGREPILKAYHHAIDEKYRFFSYGDAMFITPHA